MHPGNAARYTLLWPWGQLAGGVTCQRCGRESYAVTVWRSREMVQTPLGRQRHIYRRTCSACTIALPVPWGCPVDLKRGRLP